MVQRVVQSSLNWGEISPDFYGRTDLPQYRAGCSTLRNMFVSPRGGVMSRGGTKFCGQSKTSASASSTPPTLIPFQFSVTQAFVLEFGDLYMRVWAQGAPVTETPLTLSAVTQANPGVFTTSAPHGFSIGDDVFFETVLGMTALNGLTCQITTVPTSSSFTVTPVFPGSSALDTTSFGAFVSGQVARIYTLTTPYAIADTALLKFTQSADVMSLVHPLYPPYDLARITDASWTLTRTTFAAGISPPGGVFAQASTTTGATVSTQYMYVVTAVDTNTGQESIASQPGVVTNSVNIALTLGANTITWNSVTGAAYYNLYKAPPSYGGPVPVGSLFGYMGTTYGLSFVDTNIVQDMSIVPPLHKNPFATSSILFYTITNSGSGYTNTTAPPQAIIADPTGTGASAYGVEVSGGIVALIPTDAGEGYTSPSIAVSTGGTGTGATAVPNTSGNWVGATVVTATGSGYVSPTALATWATGSAIQNNITLATGGHVTSLNFFGNLGSHPPHGSEVTITIQDGSGSGATATASLGPSSGTWPSCVGYFQQRRFYANTSNEPDTYWGSQVGQYTNFDSRIPISDSDAIEGTPWGQQVNGIQFLVQMPGGLMIMTGLGAWQLNGGSAGAALTPVDQSAQAQGRGGCSDQIRPIPINYDILYVQQEGTIIRDLSYNFYTNIYAGTDLTLLSNHLFDDFSIQSWDWAQERHKIVWVCRDDGILLSLAYLKEQNVYGWSRHDTQGQFQGVACISEPPVNAPYFLIKRLIGTQWVYYVERMDNRLWQVNEDAWCLDSALAYPQTEPAATITASSATGTLGIGSVAVTVGGTAYTAPTCILTGANGTGTGGVVSLTVSGGVITAATVVSAGQDYVAPVVATIYDVTGQGAILTPSVAMQTTLTTDVGVFTSGNVGDVVRMGGGKILVTAYSSSTSLTGTVQAPITAVIPNTDAGTPIPQGPGDWTITTPVSTVSGLQHLEGMTCNALVDGGVVRSLTVSGGAVTLPYSGSQILIGLGFAVQMQTLYLEMPDPGGASQARRQQTYDVVLRVRLSARPEAGVNQPDQASQDNFATIPWANMTLVPPRNPSTVPGQPEPLFTGDLFTNVFANWDANSQVALQQLDPVPLVVLSLFPDMALGDTPSGP